MPINNDLLDIKSPVKNRRDEEATTRFLLHLQKIKVKLLEAPTLLELGRFIPQWCTATWKDKPTDLYTPTERLEILKDLFKGNVLPSGLETINLVFLISNIDLVDVTHLLRHRTFSFSAICSADRDMRHDNCLIKDSISFSKFLDKYIDLVLDCKQLYADMVDSNEVSLLDARTILPRSLEHHYYVRANLKDALHYIRQRLDRQIQPESDNIVALRLWIEIVKQYPPIKDLIDLDKPDEWYVKTAPTGRSSNIYMPELPRNDVFEYKEQWFMYKKQRSEMKGGHKFLYLWNQLRKELNAI